MAAGPAVGLWQQQRAWAGSAAGTKTLRGGGWRGPAVASPRQGRRVGHPRFAARPPRPLGGRGRRLGRTAEAGGTGSRPPARPPARPAACRPPPSLPAPQPLPARRGGEPGSAASPGAAALSNGHGAFSERRVRGIVEKGSIGRNLRSSGRS